MKGSRKIIDRLIILYLFFNIIYNLFGWIVPIKLMTPELIDAFIYIVMGLIGAGLVAVDILFNTYWRKIKYGWTLYGFLVVMGISTLLNISYGYMSNLKTIIWTAIQFELFYSLYQRINKEKAMKYLSILWKILAIVWTVPVLYSIFQFLMLDSYYTLIWGKKIKQGFVENRLFGIFSDPNYAAMVSLLLIIGMIFLACRTTKKWEKVIYVGYSILMYIYIVLSGSRTAEVGLLMTVFIYIYALGKKNGSGRKQIIKTVFYCVLSMIIVVSAWEGTKIVFQKLPQKVNTISFVNEYKENKNSLFKKMRFGTKQKMDKNMESTIKSKNVLERKDGKEGNISNNRIEIWKSYLGGMKHHFLFGMSPRNSVQVFVNENPKSYIAKTDYETHNGYLSIFIATGFCGSILMLIFTILKIKDVWQIFFAKEKIKIECLTCILIIVNIAIFTFFFTELFFVNDMFAALFWSILGMMEYWRDKKYENG